MNVGFEQKLDFNFSRLDNRAPIVDRLVRVYVNDTFQGGRLLCDGVGVADEQVVIKVNGTVVDVVTTAGDGSYTVTLDLQPEENEATSYQLEAIYYGDDALNLTGLALLPDGTKYAVCTTFQYFGYKPSSNTAMLTVEPASTQITASSSITETEDGVEIAPPKTPEELEQEAKDQGRLSIWHEFSWWYLGHEPSVRVSVVISDLDLQV